MKKDRFSWNGARLQQPVEHSDPTSADLTIHVWPGTTSKGSRRVTTHVQKNVDLVTNRDGYALNSHATVGVVVRVKRKPI